MNKKQFSAQVAPPPKLSLFKKSFAAFKEKTNNINVIDKNKQMVVVIRLNP